MGLSTATVVIIVRPACAEVQWIVEVAGEERYRVPSVRNCQIGCLALPAPHCRICALMDACDARQYRACSGPQSLWRWWGGRSGRAGRSERATLFDPHLRL